MSNRTWAAVTALLVGALAAAWAPAADVRSDKSPTKGSNKESGADVFGLTRLHAFHLVIPAAEWEKMQPARGGRFPGGFGRPAEPPTRRPNEEKTDVHRGSGFGMEFPWARGEFTAGGRTYRNVGLRFKGNASYMASARGLKRNFKIELDHYDKGLRFHGLKSLNLNAGAMDPTKAREALSYAVFRAAGVPAPRTAFVEVTLTVPGKYDREYLGLYTLVEQVDRTFLKDRFGNGKGLLLKPERLRGLNYLGEDWDRYRAQYRPRREPSKAQARRLIGFVKLVNRADDESFRKEVGSYLDVGEFLRFVAVNALLANLDSFLMLGHNFYIYLRPDTNQFVFIPWDLDLSLAGFPMGGAADRQTDLSLTHPHAGENKLIDRLLADEEVSAKYRTILTELATTCFTKERFLRDVEAIEVMAKGPLAREARAAKDRKEGGGGFGFRGRPGMFGRSFDLRTFVARRTESVAEQLEGKRNGFTPSGGFGFGGRPGGPGGFGPGNFLARPLMQALAGDRADKVTKDEMLAGVRKFFQDCDRNDSGKIDAKALADGLNRIFPRPPGFGPPGFGPPGFGPPGRGPGGPRGGPGRFDGPGTMLAEEIVKRADKDRDGKVTRDELATAAEALFQEFDRDRNGSLDEKEVAAAVGRLLPAPPGFGPPGFGPPRGRPGERREERP